MKGEPVPEFAARQAQPGEVFTINDWRGVIELTADARGIVQPKDALDEAVCIGLGLPLATKPAKTGKETD